jgi:Flp pilus assembly protein TadG
VRERYSAPGEHGVILSEAKDPGSPQRRFGRREMLRSAQHDTGSERRRAWGRSLARPRRGQAIVETALVLPIFLLVVFGLFDLGRVVFLKVELENAVREGARAGMVMATLDQAAVRNIVTRQPGLAGTVVTASCADPSPCAYGSRLTVSATLPVTLVAGVLPAPSLTLAASASVRLD